MAESVSNSDRPLPAKKTQRRWLQFSLRSLLICVIAAAVASGWLGQKIEQKNKERDATAAIIHLGGSVRFDYQENPLGKPPGPAWLNNLLGEHLFREVIDVRLLGPKIGDAELAVLKALPALERLDLNDTHVTDAGLAQLEGLTRLKGLNLAGTNVSDAGLDHLARLANLEWLILGDSDISDSGVAKLKCLSHLQHLSLSQTKVTFAGEIDVQRALPECRIIR